MILAVFKYFFLGVAIQVFLVVIAMLLGLADLVLLPYWVPLNVAEAFVEIPDDFIQRYGFVAFVALMCLPGLLYSAVFALIMLIVKRIRSVRHNN